MPVRNSILPILCGCVAFAAGLFPNLIPGLMTRIREFQALLWFLPRYDARSASEGVSLRARIGFMTAGFAFVLLGLFAASIA
jgi:hypothetical protein